MREWIVRAGSVAVVTAVLCGLTAGRGSAQEAVEDLAARCAGVNPALSAPCGEAALAFQAVAGGLGLLASGGAQVPGSASTLGKRFGGVPRMSASLKAGAARIPTPDVRAGGSPFADDPYWGMAAQASLAVGVFDGFSVVPTIGGIFALDLFASGAVLRLPAGQGFDGNTTSWGGGASVGILRESFTMPGVTVSGAWRRVGEVKLGSRAAGDAAEVELSPTVQSLRAVVGKDLLAFGVLAGLGWDRYSSDGSIAVTGPAGTAGSAAADGFRSDRKLVFGGVSLSMLVLQLSAEGGIARGFRALPGRAMGGYDPESSSFFLTAAGRLTL